MSETTRGPGRPARKVEMVLLKGYVPVQDHEVFEDGAWVARKAAADPSIIDKLSRDQRVRLTRREAQATLERGIGQPTNLLDDD